MTPQEMHIGIDLIMEKVNSKSIDAFEPEEKDWALNEEVLRFVKQRSSELSNDKKLGFQATQKRYDDIKSLITPVSLPTYIQNNNSVFSYLPSDYIGLINDRTVLKNLCGASYSAIGTTGVNKYVCIIPIANDATNLYSKLKIRINGVQGFSIFDYPNLIKDVTYGVTTVSYKFAVIDLVVQVLNTNGFACKYSDFWDVSSNGAIIMVRDVPFTVDIEYAPATIVSVASTLKALLSFSTQTNTIEKPNRLTDTEILYDLLNSSFGTTTVESPISSLERGKIILHHKQKFIPTTLNIDYIKKPRKISLSLNQACDLDESVHSEIVENTAKRLAAFTMSEAYKNIINENLLKE